MSAFWYTRKDSPHIYVCVYDKLETGKKKRQPFATKLRKGNKDDEKKADEIVMKLKLGLEDYYFNNRFNIQLQKSPSISEGLIQYYNFKIDMKDATKNIYNRAVNYFVDCNEDKPVSSYNQNHFSKFINYLKVKGASPQSQAIYLRHLKGLFNYFVNEGYIPKNIVPTKNPPKKKVMAIPPNEVKVIVDFFKNKITDTSLSGQKREDVKQQYYLVKFLLLTGMRISSALVQTWEDIIWDEGYMRAINVKANNREFTFPLHASLLKLLTEEMGGKTNGRLFTYSIKTGSPVFWRRAMAKLYEKNKITSKYTLHQIRKTFGTMVRRSGADLSTVKDLLDHSNIKVTSDSYTENMSASLYKQQLNNINFEGDERQ